MSEIPTITLNNGVEMPQVGFGVFQVPDDGAQEAVELALEAGYRSIDTAMIYGNEEGVGRALAASGIDRGDVFVTTKLWISDLGPGKAAGALDASLERLALDYVDLYLIHWPAPNTEDYLDTWQQFTELSENRTRAVGVSNFLPEHLDRVAALGGAIPAVNQVELHPAFQNRGTVDADERHGIATEAWSPLAQGSVLTAPAVVEIADRHEVTPAQVVLRWHVQNGTIVIPKSVTPDRIASNFDLFSFDLTATESAAIDELETGARVGPNPATFNG